MKRDDIVLSAVIAIGCSATTFALVYMVKVGVKQESLFALVGALIGAAATVAGAAWVVERNRALERDAEIHLLLGEFQKLLGKSLRAQKAEPGTGMAWPKEYRPSLLVLADVAGNIHAICGEALSHAKALTFTQRVAVRRVQFATNEFLRFWTDANAEGELEPWDERSFPVVTAEITHECKVAIAELEGRVPFAEES